MPAIGMGRHRSAKLPGYVQNVLQKGDKVNKGNNGVYYLYRIPDDSAGGKPVYYGRIMPDGTVVPAKQTRRSINDEQNNNAPSLLLNDYTLSTDVVWEFGFSHFMVCICAPILKEIAGVEGDSILRDITLAISPHSYLNAISVESGSKHQIAAWKKKLYARLHEVDSGLNLGSLYEELKSIVMVESADKRSRRISRIASKQAELFQKWNITL